MTCLSRFTINIISPLYLIYYVVRIHTYELYNIDTLPVTTLKEKFLLNIVYMHVLYTLMGNTLCIVWLYIQIT